jgi:hypothetical protein
MFWCVALKGSIGKGNDHDEQDLNETGGDLLPVFD